MTTLLDTGPLVAYLYQGDTHHDWVTQQADELSPPLYSCEAVLSEAHFLLSGAPQGTEKLLELLARNVIQIPFSYTDHADRVHELMRAYSDLPMSFADACLVRMSEVRDDSRVFTVDSDFRVYQRHGTQAIPVLMPD
jgi:predicted nucleic acid-binding protein